jgi:hypothetical protein
VNEGRQRALQGLVSAAIIFGMLAPASGCQAGSSIEAAQTAIIAAQTILPGAQATAQAGATLVSGAFSNSQPALNALQGLLAGATLDVKTTPDGVENAAVTKVTIDATDAQGALGQVDPRARQAAGVAALLSAAQYYPNAAIDLNVVDTSGAVLLSGSVAPGQLPAVQ